MFAGSSAETPVGASGMPTSVLERTSVASVPTACPTCEPNIAPPAWLRMPTRGPAIALASSGKAFAIAATTCSAIGSTIARQVGIVDSTHCERLHAAVRVAAAGMSVAVSSQTSARRMASSTADDSVLSGEGSGEATTVRRADVRRQVPVDRTLVRREHPLHLLHQEVHVGHLPAAAEHVAERAEHALHRGPRERVAATGRAAATLRRTGHLAESDAVIGRAAVVATLALGVVREIVRQAVRIFRHVSNVPVRPDAP